MSESTDFLYFPFLREFDKQSEQTEQVRKEQTNLLEITNEVSKSFNKSKNSFASLCSASLPSHCFFRNHCVYIFVSKAFETKTFNQVLKYRPRSTAISRGHPALLVMYSSQKNNLTAYSIVEMVLVLLLSTQTWCFSINSPEEIYAKISTRQHRKLNGLFLNTDQFKYNKHECPSCAVKYWCVKYNVCST